MILEITATCVTGIVAGFVIAKLLGLPMPWKVDLDSALAIARKLEVPKPPEARKPTLYDYSDRSSGMMANVCIQYGTRFENPRRYFDIKSG